MALSFPLSLAAFFSDLAMVSITFDLGEAVAGGETGGGEVLRVDYGPRLWQGRVSLARLRHVEAERLASRARTLLDARASFFVTPLHNDPFGPFGASGTINNIRNNRELRIAGLTAGQEVPQGAFLSFSYGSPSRYALHQTVEPATADGTGLTGWVEVTPAIRAGVTIGAAVALNSPVCKAVAVPNSWRPGTIRAALSDGFSFDWRQTLK